MSRDSFGLDMKPIKIRSIKIGGFGSVKKPKRSLGRNDKDIVYIRAKRKCEACGKRIDQSEMQVGHKTAYSKGGATTLANSTCLCYRCNKLQGTGSLTTLKKKLSGTYGTRSKKELKKINQINVNLQIHLISHQLRHQHSDSKTDSGSSFWTSFRFKTYSPSTGSFK